MQVSIAFAEKHAKEQAVPVSDVRKHSRRSVHAARRPLFRHRALLDYPAPYDDMLYRFADFNAGHYASRNAAFQNAVSIVTGSDSALDGDLLSRQRCEQAEQDGAGRAQDRGAEWT